MSAVTAFLESIKQNSQLKKTLNIGEPMLDYLINEASFDGNKSWVKAMPVTPIDQLLQGLGTAVSSHRDGIISRPSCLRMVNGEIWVGSYGKPIARFDTNFSFLGYWVGKYADPNREADGYAYVRSFAVDEENDRIYIAMEVRHMVRAFRLSDGAFIWQFGNGQAGHLEDSKLYNPQDVELLPNGNVLITSYNGYGYDPDDDIEGIGHGHVSEFSGLTGSLVKSRIMYLTNGNGWQHEVSNPNRARIQADGRLYVSAYNRHHISVWNPETWEYIATYSKPAGFDIDGIYPRGMTLSLDQQELVVVCNGPKMLVTLGVEDFDYKWHSGSSEWDDRKQATNSIGGFSDIWDVLPVGADRYLVADYGNNRIQIVPNNNRIAIPYNLTIPQGFKVVWKPDGYDLTSNTLTLPYNTAQAQGDIYLLLERTAQGTS